VHKGTDLVEAWVAGIVVEVEYNTSVDSAAAVELVRHTCGVDRVWKERQRKRENSIEVYGR